MQATVGDTLVVHGHHMGDPDRLGEILAVHGEGGTPPFLVRWDDDGHVGLVFPGPDASVTTTNGAAPARARSSRKHGHPARAGGPG
jgi:hypothetical protein